MIELINKTNDKITVDNDLLNNTITAVDSIIDRNTDILDSTSIKKYSSKVYHSLEFTTTKLTTSTSNVDLLLMRGKVSDPFGGFLQIY